MGEINMDQPLPTLDMVGLHSTLRVHRAGWHKRARRCPWETGVENIHASREVYAQYLHPGPFT